MGFKDFKKNSASLLADRAKAMDKLKKGNFPVDERFWYPERGKDGNGSALIRFLPAIEGEDNPWVKLWSHRFKGPGGWYSHNCLSTIGKDDPVMELNNKLWATGTAKNKAQASKQKRKLEYISNIVVLKDPAHPENVGKVFLYRYGQKVMDMIQAQLFPDELSGKDPVDVFNPYTGANFLLKVVTVKEGENEWPNYDKSEFQTPGPFDKDESVMEALYAKAYPLLPFIAADQFKTYDELKASLVKVLGPGGMTVSGVAAAALAEDKPDIDDEIPYVNEKEPDEAEDVEDLMSQFQKLAKED